MNIKYKSNIFSVKNISERLNNSLNSNRSLNEGFLKTIQKIIQSIHHNSPRVNNYMNKNQEDKINSNIYHKKVNRIF